MQVKYSLILLLSRDCLTTLRQGQPILPALGIRPVENVRKRERTEEQQCLPQTHGIMAGCVFNTNRTIFSILLSDIYQRKKRYISNEAKGHYELGVYFLITLRNDPSKNCTLNANLKMN